MSTTIKISVAMATYNGEQYIRQQLESILQQTRPVDEIIIVDDHSSDETLQVIRSLRDSRIHIFQNDTNLGYIENFYKAISMTKGDYVFLSDQDDIWALDKIERSMLALTASDENMAVCSGFRLIDQDGNSIEHTESYQLNAFLSKAHKSVEYLTLHQLAFGNVVQGCTYGIRRAVIDVYVRIHNTEVIHDYQLMLIAAALGKVVYLNVPLIQYRLHGDNAVGFAEKSHKIEVPHSAPKREPFMVRFFRQIDQEVPIRHLDYYLCLYYCRIPYLISILKKLLLGG